MANKLYEENDVAKIAGKINSYTGKNKAYKLSEMADGVDEAVEQGYTEGIEQGKGEGYAEAEAITAAIIDRSVTEINIPEGVTKIGDYAFCGCSYIVKFTIPDSVVEIGNQACNSIGSNKGTVEIIMPNSITKMGTNAFVWSGVKKFVISKNIDKIEASVFGGCSKCELYDFSRHEAVPTLVNVNAFDQMTNYKIAKILVPPDLYSEWVAATNWSQYADYINKPSEGLDIRESWYENGYMIMGVGTCKDELLIIPATYENQPVTDANYYAFQNNTNIVTVVLPSGYKRIAMGMFFNCTRLEKILIPESVTYIGSDAFDYCASLKSITMPSSSEWSPYFAGCTSLKLIDFSKVAAVPELFSTNIPFNDGMQIIVPANLYNEWIVATNWSAYADYIVAAD